jgi:hypothetical protein
MKSLKLENTNPESIEPTSKVADITSQTKQSSHIENVSESRKCLGISRIVETMLKRVSFRSASSHAVTKHDIGDALRTNCGQPVGPHG